MSLVLPPRLNASLLHPRYWFTWLGTGLLWLVIQLPYPLLMAMAAPWAILPSGCSSAGSA